jgi:predicted MFS family arabinose efflux permease
MMLAFFSFLVAGISLLMYETRSAASGRHCARKLLNLSFDLFRTRTIVFATIICMLCNMAAIGASYVLPFFALDSGLSTATTGLLFMPYAITSSLGASASGIVSDIVGRKRPLIVVTFVSGIAMIVLSYVPGTPILIASVFGFVGLCFGPVITLTSTLLADEVVGTDSRILGTSMGTFNMIRWSGGALGPVLGGILLDIYGAGVSFIVLSLMIVTSALFSLGIRESWGR